MLAKMHAKLASYPGSLPAFRHGEEPGYEAMQNDDAKQ